ncbi:MAG: ribonuclease Z [Nocardia sp.]|nr:ribonuclease Z [Nocardia sp.]
MRELVVLGTASQVPTRRRNHNGYLLRWDGEGLLFDPGEGTQRQMLYAGVSATGITRICLTHFHGDHCLGLPGVLARFDLDRVEHPVDICFPEAGGELLDHLCAVVPAFAGLRRHPISADGPLPGASSSGFTLEAVRLSHRVETYGYRLIEPDGARMEPARLAELGIEGPAVGELRRAGRLTLADGRVVTVDAVSRARPGQRFAFVMDTRMCSGVEELADGADMLVIESTFLEAEAELADRFGHLTAAQAGQVAAAAGVRTLVLTHFSQRYGDPTGHRDEARRYFAGDLVVAEDLMRVPMPPRR